MKRKIGYLLTVLILIATIISASACSFVKNDEAEGGDGEAQAYSYSHLVSDSSVSLKDSIDIASPGASFKSSGATEYNNLEEVLDNTKVERSVVTVYCTYGNSASIGSGVIVDVDDGVNFGPDEEKIFYIITCHHVIDDLPNYNNGVTVYVPDEEGNNYDDEGYNKNYAFTGSIGGAVSAAMMRAVSLVGGDKYADIAVLRLYVSDHAIAKTIQKAKVSADALKLGKSVFAIGNPQGSHAGWVSSIGSIADLKNTSIVESIGSMNLIGVNIDIYPGNSGGGLFNMKGELVGITNSGDAVEVNDVTGNTQVISQGLNYAIPNKNSSDKKKDKGFINVAKQLIDTYHAARNNNYGYVYGRRVQFGFISQEVNSSVVVASVSNNSMAYSAGLRVGDVITKIQVNSGELRSVFSNSVINEIINNVSIGDAVYLIAERTTNESRKTTKTIQINLKVYQYYFCNTQNYQGISN